MDRFIFKAKFWLVILILLIGILALRLTVRDVPVISQAEQISKDAIAPLESGVMKVSQTVNEFLSGITSFGETKSQNKELKKKISGLETEVTRLKGFEYENVRLRDMLEFKQSKADQYEMVTASVIARDPSNWLKRITIDRGSADGIQKDMPVVTQDGLIGKILKVSAHNSEVILILDSTGSGVGGMVQISDTFGVVEGVDDDLNNVRMIHLPRDANIMINQTIITSGLGGIYPRGIPIGRVVKIQPEPNGILKYATVKPYADFDRLQDVFVIKKVFNQGGTGQGGR